VTNELQQVENGAGLWWSAFTERLRGTAFDPSLLPSREQEFATTLPSLAHCPGKLIVVDIAQQSLQLVVDGNVSISSVVSTSKYGAGCRQNTGCTPLGWHRVIEKIGDDAAAGTIFKGRRVSGMAECLQSTVADDLITSRILWLDGLQQGFNRGGQVDSKDRYIYLHGTAQEHLLGQPVSEGCVRLSNADVIALYDCVELNTPVFIS
jgi:hypothetical protein